MLLAICMSGHPAQFYTSARYRVVCKIACSGTLSLLMVILLHSIAVRSSGGGDWKQWFKIMHRWFCKMFLPTEVTDERIDKTRDAGEPLLSCSPPCPTKAPASLDKTASQHKNENGNRENLGQISSKLFAQQADAFYDKINLHMRTTLSYANPNFRFRNEKIEIREQSSI